METPTALNSLPTSTNSTVGLLIATFLLSCVWRVLEWVWFRPKKLERQLRQQGLPVRPYRLFHGDFKDITRMASEASSTPMAGFSHDHFPRIRPFLHRAMEKDGEVCVMWEGTVPTVLVGDAKLVKEVLLNNDEFRKPKPNPLLAILIKGLSSYDGEKWAQHRKLINPAFHMEKLKLMLPAFYTSCNETLEFWEKKVSNAEHEIDVWADLPTLSADSISRAAFGSSYKEGRRIFQLIKEQIIVIIDISQSMYFPGRRYLPTKDNKKMKALEKEIRTLLMDMIQKRYKEKDPRDDLLGILMDSNSQNDQLGNKIKKQKIRITTDELIDECKLFYTAGQETISTLLTWSMILLANHQDWQAKARNEVLQVFGTNQPNFNGLSNLKIVNMILLEVLRLYPPSIELRRKVANDNTRLGSQTLPKGVMLNLSIAHIHHNHKVWGDDAKEFNPERFSRGISSASKGSVSFLGFGWGPRICIGSNFVMTEAKIALSMVLQRFKFQLSPSYVHAPSGYGFLHPQFGAPIIFNRI